MALAYIQEIIAKSNAVKLFCHLFSLKSFIVLALTFRSFKHAIIFAISYCLHRPAPFSVGGDYPGYEYQEVGIIGGHLGSWFLQSFRYIVLKVK